MGVIVNNCRLIFSCICLIFGLDAISNNKCNYNSLFVKCVREKSAWYCFLVFVLLFYVICVG